MDRRVTDLSSNRQPPACCLFLSLSLHTSGWLFSSFHLHSFVRGFTALLPVLSVLYRVMSPCLLSPLLYGSCLLT
ncbi:hypothetical protein BDV98DRAFT_567296 [Pterulicium gracile]|uniref:Uncharacterized protein n=1 Tax=Pterulicium gracile TaxID=1884261 RepID=A0A5C3QJX4_9AGAR|nr:hypothetical protein BDV98DRAFT_567296 [Pterula gracilis]